MAEPDRSQLLLDAAGRVVGALARVLLRNGIPCGSLEQVVRKAYVDEAWRAAAAEGRATVSGVAARTGLSRKEVKRLRELDGAPDAACEERYSRAVRVLAGWLNDRSFCNEEGIPLPLPLQGAGSFGELVRAYSGDMTPKAMLDLLRDAGCVLVEGGHAHLVRRAYVPAGDAPEVLRMIGVDASELIATIDHNMTHPPEERRFQRRLATGLLPRRLRVRFRELVRARSQALLEELLAWLEEHEATPDEEPCAVSVGIYHYEDDVPEEDDA